MTENLAMNALSKDKFRGSLLGLAVGDALGTTLEFKLPGAFEPIDDMVGGGPFGLEVGQWTDDTSMALCLAESLLVSKGMDLGDQCETYLRWWLEGHLSVTGECFDIGNTVRSALQSYRVTGTGASGSMDRMAAGNGSIMRLAPVPLFYAADPVSAVEQSAESSRTTHGATEAVDACRLLCSLILGAIRGYSKEDLLFGSDAYEVSGLRLSELEPRIRSIADGDYREAESSTIRGTGYVVESLRAALWAFHRGKNFREGALLAVNLGDDADTTGAVYGQLAGAYYGQEGIPSEWLNKLAWKDRIKKTADRLHQVATMNPVKA